MSRDYLPSEKYSALNKLLASKTITNNFNNSTALPVFIQRFLFNKRDQQPKERIDKYAFSLKSLANACEFGDFTDAALKDRFIAGLCSVRLQDLILTELALLDYKETPTQLSFGKFSLLALSIDAKIKEEEVIKKINQMRKRTKRQNVETLGKSFGRDDFQTLNDDKQDGSSKSVTSNSDKKDEVKDGKSPKSKGTGANQRNSNEHSRQNNNRPPFRNDANRSSGSETSKDGGKKQYNNNMNRQRNDGDMGNRNDTRNMNQYHNRNNRNSDNDGPTRNVERDGTNRNSDRDGPNRNSERDSNNRNSVRDGPNRNSDRDGPNRYSNRDGGNRNNNDRDGPNRNTDRDGQNRHYNNNNQNRRRGDPSHSDSDNYTGGYERSSDGRGSGRNQSSNNSRGDGQNHHQQGKGASGGHQNNQNFNNQAGKKNDPKERNYVPPTPIEDEDELFAIGITSGVNFIKFDEIPVNVSGEDIPPAIDSFDNSGLHDFVVQNTKRSGYSHPTPIQKNAIPIILAGRDIMACAQTGSGKTAAFLLPIISKLLSDEKPLSGNKPHVLVVSPTRELGIQIETECRKFATKSFLKTLLVYGGTSSGYQIDKAKNGCHLLIATPGRLLDFIGRGIFTFEDLRYLVLDEADRMLDMGFLSDIEKLMEHSSMPSPDKRQTLMFSATFPEEIQRLAGKFLNAYLFVAVGIVGGASTDVEQCVYEVPKFEKRKKLMEIIEKEEPDGIMVFVETKRNADFLASFLSEKQVLTTSMHGDRYQRQREEALNDFKSGKMKLLIATSVGARGLDIKNVRHVVNFDMPQSIDEYVHRIGRTGRVGNCGKATSFFDPEEDYSIAGDLKKILHQAGQKVPEFLMDVHVPSSKHGTNKRGNFGGKDVRKGQNHRKSNRDAEAPQNDNRNMQPDEPIENW